MWLSFRCFSTSSPTVTGECSAAESQDAAGFSAEALNDTALADAASDFASSVTGSSKDKI